MAVHPLKTFAVVLVVTVLVLLQEPVKDVHTVRSFSYKKSVHQIPSHTDLYHEIRKESAGSTVSLGKHSFLYT